MEGILVDVLLKDDGPVERELDSVVVCKLSEMDIFNYDIEVIKALAVILRSQISKRIKNSKYYVPEEEEITICENRLNSMTDTQRQLLKRAAFETRGIIAVNGDNAVDLFYTKCCGGGTANSEDILGYRLNYLRKILCRFCSEEYMEKSIAVNDIIEKLGNKKLGYKDEIDNIFKNIERDETGRIINIEIIDKQMTGEEFVKFIGLSSNRVYFQENSILFKSIGDGLGLGICLEGADFLTKQGMDYKDIIKYYYTGIEFKLIDEESVSRLLVNKKIIIDPGHGGTDLGNIKESRIEKSANLEISYHLEKLLKKLGANVIMTRDEDVYVPLGERVELINNERPEFFISIHQNNFISSGVNGLEIYCYDKDKEAIKLGRLVAEQINRTAGIKNRGVRIGDYYLLRECKVSGLILECMYITGDEDGTKYTEENYISVAQGIFEGICRYYNIAP